MSVAYIEYRPYASSEYDPISHYVIIVDGIEVYGSFSTQKAAKDTACAKGHRPVYEARQRHLQDRKKNAHWRVDPC